MLLAKFVIPLGYYSISYLRRGRDSYGRNARAVQPIALLTIVTSVCATTAMCLIARYFRCISMLTRRRRVWQEYFAQTFQWIYGSIYWCKANVVNKRRYGLPQTERVFIQRSLRRHPSAPPLPIRISVVSTQSPSRFLTELHRLPSSNYSFFRYCCWRLRYILMIRYDSKW